jgi:hypothetical protein
MALFLRSLLISAVLSMGLSSPAHAQFVTGAIAGAIGGAGRGAVDPGEVSYLNPASVAHLQQYYFSAHYHNGNYGVEGDRTNYGLLLADGMQGSVIPGAFSYTRKLIELPGVSATLQDFAVTLAGFPLRHVSLGVTGHRTMSSIPLREDTQDNAHVGILVNPRPYLGLGLVVHDILNSTDSIPAVYRLNRTYSVGAHIMMTPTFRLRLDAAQPERQSGYEGRRTDVMGGLETFFNPEWTFRAGAQWKETLDQTNLTTGIGYRGPRLSFDYSFQKDVRSETGSRHLVDLWLPL